MPTIRIKVDHSKCVGCRDCTIICPAGVYEMRKENAKLKAFPVDLKSCCGLSCRLCMDTCWKQAIEIVRIE